MPSSRSASRTSLASPGSTSPVSSAASHGVILVIPCFQEAQRLHATFAGLLRAREALGEGLRACLVDDGSTDGTAQIARELAKDLPWVSVLAEPHRGKGGALRAGVMAAEVEGGSDVIVMADADWSMAPGDLPQLLAPLAEGADLAIASRELPGAVRVEEPGFRHLLGRGFNWWVQRWLLGGIEDSQCGFKAFRADVAKALFAEGQTDGWAFDVEILHLARQRGLRLAEVPIRWVFEADSRVRPGIDALAMALDVVRIWWRHRR